jgi:hypothetical protein
MRELGNSFRLYIDIDTLQPVVNMGLNLLNPVELSC